MTVRTMNVLIYGGGAVGLGIASCLLKAGIEVDILAKQETTKLLRQEGLIRTGIFGNASAKAGTFGALSSLDEVANKRFEYILVCTKFFDLKTVAKDIHVRKDLLKDQNSIVLFQNGWGNTEIFSALFAEEIVYNARVITGFIRPKRNHVDITVHADAIHIGHLHSTDTEAIEPVCEAITTGGIPCKPVSDIGKDMWAKMLYNCALNPLSAIFGVSYGKLGEREETKQIMDMVVREIFLVMAAAKYSTHWGSPKEYLNTFYKKLIPLTAKHESSMLQDLRTGNRTEIDAINGAIVKLGQQHDRKVPANSILYNMVKFLEGGVYSNETK